MTFPRVGAPHTSTTSAVPTESDTVASRPAVPARPTPPASRAAPDGSPPVRTTHATGLAPRAQAPALRQTASRLMQMPGEVFDQIAGLADAGDRAALAATSQLAAARLLSRTAAAGVARLVDTVLSTADFEKTLDQVKTLRTDLQGEVFAKLMGRIDPQGRPGLALAGAYGAARLFIASLPWAYRSGPMRELFRTLRHVADAATRCAGIKAGAAAALELPVQGRLAPLAELAARMRGLSGRVLEDAFAAVAAGFAGLPSADRLALRDALLDTFDALPAGPRMFMHRMTFKALHQLGDHEACEGVLARAAPTAGARPEVLSVLAMARDVTPSVQARTAISLVGQLDALAAQTDMRNGHVPIRTFIEGIDVAERAEPLRVLLEKSSLHPDETVRFGFFCSGFQATEKLNPSDRGPVYAALGNQLGGLPPQQRKDGYLGLLMKFGDLAAEDRPAVLKAMVSRFDQLPPADRAQAFHATLEAIGHWPGTSSGELLDILLDGATVHLTDADRKLMEKTGRQAIDDALPADQRDQAQARLRAALT